MFRTQRRVEFADTDMAGIVHFSNFFRFMESAEQEFLRSLGLGVQMSWQGQPIGLPRVAAACDYKKPARFEDVIDIAVSILEIGRKSITYRFEFSKDGQHLARGQISAVCCRVVADHQLESMEIPPDIRQKLEATRAE